MSFSLISCQLRLKSRTHTAIFPMAVVNSSCKKRDHSDHKSVEENEDNLTIKRYLWYENIKIQKQI